MWCPRCRRDVDAAEGLGGSSVCVACGGPVTSGGPAGGGEPPAAQRARALLDQWSHLFEEGGAAKLGEDLAPAPAAAPQPQLQAAHAPKAVAPQVAVADRPKRARKPRTQPPQWRIDASHGTPAEAAAARGTAPSSPAASPMPAPHRVPADAPRIHAGHAAGPSAPHFDPVAAGTFGGGPARTSGPLGQALAYAGVLGLTVGGSLVIWSYFGGPATYAPTGWLLTVAGQMLLFLGVVTLMSGGMERTTHEVRTRIETLGGSLARIEQAQKQAMKAPHIPPEAFAAGGVQRVESREQVAA